jgi:hypothetical protein
VTPFKDDPCGHGETTSAYAVQALTADEAEAAEAHIAGCLACQRELGRLQAVVRRLAAWPTDIVRPSASLQERLSRRIAEETGSRAAEFHARRWCEPEWEQVARGIHCKLLANDSQRRRVSMLVRLAPGASYPPHTHAGVEELHLLDGELWIDDRKLLPGDYNYGPPGASDERVWSETGCTCLLVTSTEDTLR